VQNVLIFGQGVQEINGELITDLRVEYTRSEIIGFQPSLLAT